MSGNKNRKLRSEPLTIDYFRYRSEIDPETGCWNWQNAVAWNGYGVMKTGGKAARAHRISFICATGQEIGPDTDICHRCDNRRCVNPAHLFAGTRSDNMADCSRKGRLKMPFLSGEACPAAKLTPEQVLSIREDQRSQRELGRVYGVDKGTIAAIKSGKTWASI